MSRLHKTTHRSPADKCSKGACCRTGGGTGKRASGDPTTGTACWKGFEEGEMRTATRIAVVVVLACCVVVLIGFGI